MKEIFLLKLGEIVLKGANKRQFEDKLRQNIRRRMKAYGNFDVYLMQSTVYVEPMDDDADVDGAWEACRCIFGLVSLCRCRACEKDIDTIYDTVVEYLGDDLSCAESFKVESKRADKRFPLTSIGISQEIGGRLAEAYPDCRVDVHKLKGRNYISGNVGQHLLRNYGSEHHCQLESDLGLLFSGKIINNAVYSVYCSLGMHGGNDRMSGFCRGNGGAYGLGITHFSQKYNVGSLPQTRAQSGEVVDGVYGDLALTHYAFLIFMEVLYWILESDNVTVASLVDPVYNACLSGGFSAAGGSGK